MHSTSGNMQVQILEQGNARNSQARDVKVQAMGMQNFTLQNRVWGHRVKWIERVHGCDVAVIQAVMQA